jgi:hypothetical protein
LHKRGWTPPPAAPYHSDIFIDGVSHGDTSCFHKSLLRGETGHLFNKKGRGSPRPEKTLPKELEIEQDGKPAADVPLVAHIIPTKGRHGYPIVISHSIPGQIQGLIAGIDKGLQGNGL